MPFPGPHNQAPAPLEGVSPFTTPGTRLTWRSGNDWLAALEQLLARPCSSTRYQQLAAHLDELARHPDFIAAQPIEDLEGLRTAMVTHFRPPQGRRGGTSYERVLNEVSNALALQRRLLVVAADGAGRPCRILRELVGQEIVR